MINFIIKEMKIRNFKGITERDIQFDEKEHIIKAKNGWGKTTIKNAFEWGLCQNIKDIIPKYHNVEVPNVETSVEITLQVNGYDYIIKRTSKSKYLNGQKTGNETSYEIDGIELTAQQYKNQLGNILGNGAFENIAMLTDKEFFNTDTSAWKWFNRRKILLAMTGAEQQANKIIEKEKYSCIKEYIVKGFATSDIKSSLTKECNALKKRQEGNQLLIDSKQKELDEYLGIDFEKVSQELAINKTKYTKLINSTKDEQSAEQLKALETEISQARQKISTLKVADILKKKELEDFKLRIYQDAISTKSEYDRVAEEIKHKQRELDKLNISEIKDVCPICKQRLPEDEIAKAKEEQQKLIAEHNENLTTLKSQARALYEKYNSLQQQYADQENKINGFEQNKEINDLEMRVSELNLTIADIKKTDLSNLSAQQQKDLEDTISALEREMQKKEYLTKGYKQMQVWKEDNKKIADEIIEVENKEIALQEFMKEQTDTIVEVVNNYFGNGVTWNLYNTNYSGTLEETCEAMYDDKLYSCLSMGEKNVCNLEILKALQKYYEVQGTVFVDNCETMTIPYELDNQVIKLYAQADTSL